MKTPRKKDWENESEPLAPNAQKYLKEQFLPHLRDLEKRVGETVLAILVWGPAPTDERLFRKRLEIRNRLRKGGHAALFSEEIEPTDSNTNASMRDRELIQAIEADVIIVLAVSPGSIAEVHDFAGYLSVADKMLVFIEVSQRHGYSFQGALKDMNDRLKNVESFEYPRDIDECHLLGKVLERVNIAQRAKWRSTIR